MLYMAFLLSFLNMVNKLELSIEKTWDDQPVNHPPAKLILGQDPENPNFLNIHIKAHFFNDPAKPSEKQGDFFNLWDYEVVEAFFLSDSGKYLELEFGPYGHYIAIFLNGSRNVFKEDLKLEYQAEISGDKWQGFAKIPQEYLPSKVTKFNAYAIHGSDKERKYESLFPVPFNTFSSPDFHKLEYFGDIDFKKLLPKHWERECESKEWSN